MPKSTIEIKNENTENGYDDEEINVEMIDEPSSSQIMQQENMDEKPTFICELCHCAFDCKPAKNFHLRVDHSDIDTRSLLEGNAVICEENLIDDGNMEELVEDTSENVSQGPPPKKRTRRKKNQMLPGEEEFLQPQGRTMTTKELINGRRGNSDSKSRSRASTSIRNDNNLIHNIVENAPEIGEEVVIDQIGNTYIHDDGQYQYIHLPPGHGENKKKHTGKMGAPRKNTPAQKPRVYEPGKIPFRLRVGDVNGKYECYIKECNWKGGYRSLRMDHMRSVHPEWKMPSRFLLQRISKEGIYLNPDEYEPPIPCLVPGCTWRGNYRASRSAHMRQVHKEIHEENKKKTSMGGYAPEGPYLCHVTECDWRGVSRTTRSNHMKKEHPDWTAHNRQFVRTIVHECFLCQNPYSSVNLLYRHISDYHGAGLETWMGVVMRLFHITFSRKIVHRNANGLVNYLLTCSCSSMRQAILTSTRNAAYSTNFLRKRSQRIITRRKIECALHLNITENSKNGNVHVVGCLEHTGHRWGTPQIRWHNVDRQVFYEYMEYRSENNVKMPLAKLLNFFEEFESYKAPRFEPNVEPIDMEYEQADENDAISLYKLITDGVIDQDALFDVHLAHAENGRIVENATITIGYMNDEMKKSYLELLQTPNKPCIIDHSRLNVGDRELSVFTVLSPSYNPRCCCVYITSCHETGYRAICSKLQEVSPQPPMIFMVDPSEQWVREVASFFPEHRTNVLISEWTILDFWGKMVEQMISNDADQFFVMAALRKLLRIDESDEFLLFIVEFFEALSEGSCEDFIKFMDFQLSDVQYFKRWWPFQRNSRGFSNPMLLSCSRSLRENFLHPTNCDRIDKYIYLLQKRIAEFNSITAYVTEYAPEFNESECVQYEEVFDDYDQQMDDDGQQLEVNEVFIPGSEIPHQLHNEVVVDGIIGMEHVIDGEAVMFTDDIPSTSGINQQHVYEYYEEDDKTELAAADPVMIHHDEYVPLKRKIPTYDLTDDEIGRIASEIMSIDRRKNRGSYKKQQRVYEPPPEMYEEVLVMKPYDPNEPSTSGTQPSSSTVSYIPPQWHE
ncbi:unnamed protein product [Caenorhabditis bovis]|uniref:C2H2-type domain-containing protein n=1 Tax=Caenorhabditis bovis TaxID=2654633 RepID=A0A8S1EP42_9PELO|nr:unnamed protein product [Caenorhabditis bovis]